MLSGSERALMAAKAEYTGVCGGGGGIASRETGIEFW
jgi:hypothetical protein